MTIDDGEKMKLHLAGFRIIVREASIGCIREWHPQQGWRPVVRRRTMPSLNREYDRLRKDPRVIAVRL